MSIAITEAQLEATVVAMARLGGWYCTHFRPARTDAGWRTPVAADGKGWPDLVLVHPGLHRTIFAELKSEKGRLAPEQKAWLDVLEQAGQETHVWRPQDLDDVERLLVGHMQRRRGGNV